MHAYFGQFVSENSNCTLPTRLSLVTHTWTFARLVVWANRPIHSITFSATSGDQLEYNGGQGTSGSDLTAKIKLWVMESTTNTTIMYTLIQLPKEQLSLVVTKCLFHASTASDHAQLGPEDAIILQFCVALAMWHHGIFVYNGKVRSQMSFTPSNDHCYINCEPV